MANRHKDSERFENPSSFHATPTKINWWLVGGVVVAIILAIVAR